MEPSDLHIRKEDLDQVVEMINHCSRPFVFVGGGAVIADASKELKEFVYKVHAPVADSLMGKGAFDGTDDLYCGMLGMHGTKASNFGVSPVRSADYRRAVQRPGNRRYGRFAKTQDHSD